MGTFPTKADANAALTGAAADTQRGGFVAPDRGRVTLNAYAEEWLAGHPSLTPRTRDLYRILLDQHILPQLGGARLADIEPATVERWFHGLARTTSDDQRAKSYRLLRGILNHAVKNQRIIRNPCMIDNGSKETAHERPVATIPHVYALAATSTPSPAGCTSAGRSNGSRTRPSSSGRPRPTAVAASPCPPRSWSC